MLFILLKVGDTLTVRSDPYVLTTSYNLFWAYTRISEMQLLIDYQLLVIYVSRG
jgi:hypothetical protein